VALWAVFLCGSGLWHKRQYLSAFARRRSILSCRRHSPEQKQDPRATRFSGIRVLHRTQNRSISAIALLPNESRPQAQCSIASGFFQFLGDGVCCLLDGLGYRRL